MTTSPSSPVELRRFPAGAHETEMHPLLSPAISRLDPATAAAAAMRLALNRHCHHQQQQQQLLGMARHPVVGSHHGSALLETSAFCLPNLPGSGAQDSLQDQWNAPPGFFHPSLQAWTSFDGRPGQDLAPFIHCYGGGGGVDVRRKNATRESTSTLKAWLFQHIKNPYPTKGEKIMLAIITKMTLTQVSTWFANARRRLKKENKMQWSPRQRNGDDDDDDDIDEDDVTNNASARASDDDSEDEMISAYDVSVSHTSGRERIESMSDVIKQQQYGDSHQRSRSPDQLPPPFIAERLTPLPSTSGHPGSCDSKQLPVVSPTTGSTKNAVSGPPQRQSDPTSKPRIWSLVEVATSTDDNRKTRDFRRPWLCQSTKNNNNNNNNDNDTLERLRNARLASSSALLLKATPAFHRGSLSATGWLENNVSSDKTTEAWLTAAAVEFHSAKLSVTCPTFGNS